jgi:hypothetical protein
MHVEGSFRREPGNTSRTPDIFVPEPVLSHRPPTRYRLARINSPKDVETARQAHLPISILEPKVIEALGYPLTFRPRLLIPSPLLPLIETTYRIQIVADAEAARDPKIEDIIVEMLRIDVLGARRIAFDHRREIDPTRLLKRVLVENLEGRAHEIRLGDYAPGLPKVKGIRPLSRSALRAEESREFATGP